MNDPLEAMRDKIQRIVDARYESRLPCIDCHRKLSDHSPQQVYQCLHAIAEKEQRKLLESLTKEGVQ